QGEQTMRELARALTRGGSLASIAGLAIRENGGVVKTAPRPLTPLDELPDWPYERVGMERYIHSHYLGRRVGAHHTSFGCPFACTFCAVVGMSDRRWVAQSPGRVMAVVDRLHHQYRADA